MGKKIFFSRPVKILQIPEFESINLLSDGNSNPVLRAILKYNNYTSVKDIKCFL